MMTDPIILSTQDIPISMLLTFIGAGHDPLPKPIGKGLYMCSHWNFGDYCHPRIPGYDLDLTGLESGFTKLESEYGVCDSPDQFMHAFGKILESSPRKLCVAFVRVDKAKQVPLDGWRWHKWGPYVGENEPSKEYLYDEPEIETVYTYHVYEVKP